MEGYYGSGQKTAYVWSMSHNGNPLVMEDIGAGSNGRATGRIEKNQINVSDWKVKGTISADGRSIYWLNDTYWRHRLVRRSGGVIFSHSQKIETKVLSIIGL